MHITKWIESSGKAIYCMISTTWFLGKGKTLEIIIRSEVAGERGKEGINKQRIEDS